MTAFTTVPHVKDWLGIAATNTAADAMLGRMVMSATGYIRGWLNRDIALTDYAETYGGTGSARLSVANYPIVAVASVSVDGRAIPPKIGPTDCGYTWTASQIVLDGYRFCEGIDNVELAYTAGFETLEVLPIPAAAPYTVTVSCLWLGDAGVSIGNVALAKVAGAPGAGQYAVDGSGAYSFNAAQKGLLASISYGYVPPEIEQACIDIVGRKYRERDRIGMVSKGLAGETTAFSQSDMSADTKAMLNQFRKVVPV